MLGININDFARAILTITYTHRAIKNFPTPRYKPGHTLFPNNPFVGYYLLQDIKWTYETVYSKAVANSVTLKQIFAKTLTTIMAAENTGAYR